MIGKRAVKAFLARKRQDYRRYKKLTKKELDRLMRELPVQPPIWKRLRRHQKVCFIIGAQTKRFGLLLDTGTGKTLLSIALTRYFRRCKTVRKVLVLVPQRINKSEWAREIVKHSPKTKHCVLHGSSTQKWQQLETTDALIVIESYPGLVRMVCDLVPPKRGKKKNRLKPNRTRIKRLTGLFQGLVMDESTAVKNKRKLPYRVCRQISKLASMVFALSGTPFGRDPTDLWAQMYLVDKGQTLGETLGLFRAAFFTSSENFWGGVDWSFNKRKQGLLNQLLANCSIRYAAKESDLPRVVAIEKAVSLPIDAEAYYEKTKNQLITARGNFREMENAFLRMRQISSGFLGYYDDETGDKVSFEFPVNPKLELLLSIIATIPRHRKVIVFHEFRYSGRRICQELNRIGVGNLHLYGGTKNHEELLTAFDKDPKRQVLVLQNSLGIGLNLQIARYGIYYESPVPVIMRKQTRARFVRQESTHDRVFLYDLVTRGTVDQQILSFHKEGGDLFAHIIDGLSTPTIA